MKGAEILREAFKPGRLEISDAIVAGSANGLVRGNPSSGISLASWDQPRPRNQT